MPGDEFISFKSHVSSLSKKSHCLFALHLAWKGSTCTEIFVWVSVREVYLFCDKGCWEFPGRSMVTLNPSSTASISSQALHDAEWMYLLYRSLGTSKSDHLKVTEMKTWEAPRIEFLALSVCKTTLISLERPTGWMRASMSFDQAESRDEVVRYYTSTTQGRYHPTLPPGATVQDRHGQHGSASDSSLSPVYVTHFNGNSPLSPGKVDHIENKWHED